MSLIGQNILASTIPLCWNALTNGQSKKHYQHLRRIKINNITIAGTVGKDAEMKYLNDGTAIASFSIADSQGKDKTVWWNASMFGKRAESLGQYIHKGTKVTVVGQVTEDVWTDKNGQERKSMKVRVNDIALQSKREESHEPVQRAAAPAVQDEDIPFADPLRNRAYSLMV